MNLRHLLTALLVACLAPLAPAEDHAAPVTGIADAHVHHGFDREAPGIALDGFEMFAKRGISAIAYALPVRRNPGAGLPEAIAAELRQLHERSRETGLFRLAEPNGAGAAVPDSPVTIVPGIEYFSGVFGGDPTTVDTYRDLGIRYITLISNEQDPLFDGDRPTPFGLKVLERMNHSGILADISHLDEPRALAVIGHSARPVVASHTCSTKISGRDTCLTDAVLSALAKNRGFAFTTFNRNDLFRADEAGDEGAERFAEHVVHMVRILGHGRVGIGSDYQANGAYVAGGLDRDDSLARILAALREKGFTSGQIDQFSHGSFWNAFGRPDREN